MLASICELLNERLDFTIEITSNDVDLVTTFKEKNNDKEPSTIDLTNLQAELEKNKQTTKFRIIINVNYDW